MSQNFSLLNPALSLKENLTSIAIKEKLEHMTYLSQVVCIAAIQAANNKDGNFLSPEELEIAKNTIDEFNKLAAELIK